MVSDNSKKSKTRSGLAYLKHVFDVQNECEEKSSTYVEKQDSEILTTLCNLDSVMLMLDRVGSCYWGCNKGDHITERLLAKTVGFASAALRLANFGHYDEALGLIRSIGEIANLFSLFDANADLFLRWKALNEAKRKSEFGPAQVRKQLDKQNLITPMDTERYRQLCETSIHPTPHAEPQTFDRGHPPTMGGYFQSNGLAQAVFELSIQISAIAICTPGVVDLKSTAKGNVKSAGSRLANSIPGVKYEEA